VHAPCHEQVLASGIAGAFGSGPFSRARMRDPGGRLVIIVEHGKPLRDRMRQAYVDEDDVLNSARENHGLERMDQIRYAVLERSGSISIIPEPGETGGRDA
jgi:YetF C-terminal domain